MQDLKISNLNKINHLLYGQIISLLLVIIFLKLVYTSERGNFGIIYSGVVPLWIFFFLFLRYIVGGLFYSFKEIKNYKISNSPAPKQLNWLKAVSLFFITIIFLSIIGFLVYMKLNYYI